EIEKVINTGRDVTKLIQLQEDLRKAETLKDSYFNRLTELESLVGSNQIVYSSDQMRRIVSLAVKVAISDSPVFILGESGVGKELIADLIHKSSSRNKDPFIGINCSAIPLDLLEAELFGYEEGAFTGAKKGGKKGLFEEAKGGTIFLDEITELPFPMQSKLLRVLQEREFMPVGGTKVVLLQARIISASNMNQKQLSDSTKFRRDLFYRLNVIPIFIPPLRERREDILPLVRFFLKNMNLKYNTNIKISLSLMARLQNYHWPGNVRELKNIVEQLVVMADKDEVDVQDYLSLSRFEEEDGTLKDGDISVSGVMPLKTAFEKLEEILVKKAFRESGTITKTAQILEINPCTIYRKIRKGSIHLE
ncbi:MAG: sigma 54-interacting transcriptional regulator, partial [Deltaproteobacteria bacterium]|nr:sigma 54-interacting transcriptional regulator [Deltaproteobacteria bacterium]